MSKIVWLKPNQESYRPAVGGKGMGLLRLVDLQLPVPPGFILTAPLFEHYLAARLLDAAAQKASKASPGSATRLLEEISAEICADMLAGFQNSALADVVAAAYEALRERVDDGPPQVAVRSSSVAEDGIRKSFAGQHDSFLGIAGAAAVWQQVAACWSSLYTPRAIAYRLHHKDTAVPHMAVIVQQMVPALASGVMMTLNPANGDRSKIVIEALWGLGPSLVEGKSDPDYYLVDKVSGQTIRKQAALKTAQLVLTPNGVRETAVIAQEQNSFSLNHAQLQRLVQIGQQIELQLKSPQDIEFAVTDEEIYIVQTRPETYWSQQPIKRIGITAQPVDTIISTLLTAGGKRVG